MAACPLWDGSGVRCAACRLRSWRSPWRRTLMTSAEMVAVRAPQEQRGWGVRTGSAAQELLSVGLLR